MCRASVHYYNDEPDIDRLVAAVAGTGGGLGDGLGGPGSMQPKL